MSSQNSADPIPVAEPPQPEEKKTELVLETGHPTHAAVVQVMRMMIGSATIRWLTKNKIRFCRHRDYPVLPKSRIPPQIEEIRSIVYKNAEIYRRFMRHIDAIRQTILDLTDKETYPVEEGKVRIVLLNDFEIVGLQIRFRIVTTAVSNENWKQKYKGRRFSRHDPCPEAPHGGFLFGNNVLRDLPAGPVRHLP